MTAPTPVLVEPADLSHAFREFGVAAGYGWSIVFEPATPEAEAAAWLEWNVSQSRMLELLEIANPCLSYLQGDDWIAWDDSPEPSSGHYSEPWYDVRYLLAIA